MAATATESSGGLRSFSAHAASHVSSQLRMSMPFIESVPTTEYTIAVRPGAVLAVGTERQPSPYGRTSNNLSARLLSRGTCGRSTNTLSPSRWFEQRAQRLALAAGSGRPASSSSPHANRPSSAAFRRALPRVERRRLALDWGRDAPTSPRSGGRIEAIRSIHPWHQSVSLTWPAAHSTKSRRIWDQQNARVTPSRSRASRL